MSDTRHKTKSRPASLNARGVRAKVSTTVAPETWQFLERKVRSGEATNLAMAIDAAIAKVSQMENRQRLAMATAAYFSGMDQLSAAAENELAADLASASEGVDYDREL